MFSSPCTPRPCDRLVGTSGHVILRRVTSHAVSVAHASLSAEVPPQNLEAEEAPLADELPIEEPPETSSEPESD